VTTGAVRRAKLQSYRHHKQTNTRLFFTGPMPSLSPNQQCQSAEDQLTADSELTVCDVMQQGAESGGQDTEQSAREPQGDRSPLYPGDEGLYRETEGGGH